MHVPEMRTEQAVSVITPLTYCINEIYFHVYDGVVLFLWSYDMRVFFV